MSNRIQTLLEQATITKINMIRKPILLTKKPDTQQPKSKFDSTEHFMNKELCTV